MWQNPPMDSSKLHCRWRRASILLLALVVIGLATNAGAQARHVTSDFTGDGTSDLLFVNSANQLVFWDFDANGIVNVRYMGTGFGTLGDGDPLVGVGDYNGDGTSDVLTRRKLSGETGYWTVRNGVLGSFVTLISDTSPRWHVVGSRQRTDFNGDGRDDILWRHDDGTLGAYLMNADAATFTWQPLGMFPREWTVIGTGDFDADGLDDVLWRNDASGDVRYMRIAPNGATTWVDLGTRDPSSKVVAIADVDNDRSDDIYWSASAQATPTSEGWWNVNAGVVSGFNSVVPPAVISQGVQASGDYMGDGSDDLIEVESVFRTGLKALRRDFVNGVQTGTTTLMFFNGYAFVGAMQAGALGPPPRARRTSYDFTGDGMSDLLVRSASGQLSFWSLAGTPFGVIQQRVTVLGTVTTDWDVVGVGDYDGDGTSDLLFRSLVNGSIGYWRVYHGAMVSFVPLQWNVPLTWQVVNSRKRSDFNGDRRDDVLLRRADGAMGMYLVTGTAALAVQWVDLGGSDPSWNVAGTADFDGNGTDDVLFQRTSTGAVGYVRMSGTGFQGWVGLIDGLDASWSIGALADFNGDGDDDIYWRNSSGLTEGYWDLANGVIARFVPNAGANTYPGYATSAFVSGDYAGDGSEDIAAQFNTGQFGDRVGWLLFVNGTTDSYGGAFIATGTTLQ